MDASILPSVNAILNATAALFLVLGYVLIRQGKRDAHRAAMLAALACSVLFLVSYLYYHYHAGSTRFPVTGTVRTVYLSILLTHTVLPLWCRSWPGLPSTGLFAAVSKSTAQSRAGPSRSGSMFR